MLAMIVSVSVIVAHLAKPITFWASIQHFILITTVHIIDDTLGFIHVAQTVTFFAFFGFTHVLALAERISRVT